MGRVRRPWLTRNVRVLSAVSFLQDTASELLYPLLPIYLTTVLGAPPAVVGAIEGAAEGAASLTKLASGPLGDRFARRPLIATGYGMAALGKVMVAAFARLAGRARRTHGGPARQGVCAARPATPCSSPTSSPPPAAGCSDSTGRWTPSARWWVR